MVQQKACHTRGLSCRFYAHFGVLVVALLDTNLLPATVTDFPAGVAIAVVYASGLLMDEVKRVLFSSHSLLLLWWLNHFFPNLQLRQFISFAMERALHTIGYCKHSLPWPFSLFLGFYAHYGVLGACLDANLQQHKLLDPLPAQRSPLCMRLFFDGWNEKGFGFLQHSDLLCSWFNEGPMLGIWRKIDKFIVEAYWWPRFEDCDVPKAISALSCSESIKIFCHDSTSGTGESVLSCRWFVA